MRKLKNSKNRRCQECNKMFFAEVGHKYGRHCSSACQQMEAANKKNPWAEKACFTCGGKFTTRSSATHKLTCSYECGRKMNRQKRRLIERKESATNNLEIHFKENDYSKQKHFYKEMVLPYESSPTGDCYVGFAKQPLMKSVSGIGYQGVKVQSANRELIQCFECGNWYMSLTHKHLKTHGVTQKGYKEKYGYGRTTALVSDAFSNYLAKKIDETINKAGKLSQKKINSMLAKTRGKFNKGKKYSTMEMRNNHGTCPKQLKAALINYILRFRRIPHSTAKRDGFVQMNAVRNHFGSLNNLLHILGLPTRRGMGGVVEYSFPDGETVYTKTTDSESYMFLFEKMMQKCPVLTKQNF